MNPTPTPPYYAVIFTSRLPLGANGYAQMAARMVALASEQPGFLGIESVREGELGITLSYWDSEHSVARWKANLEHQVAQKLGREKWYKHYTVEVSRVERAYSYGPEP